ncbi:LPS export ABC transporter permease LptG [Dyella sp. A6]|uniref:LPS export ABC transporter permease LptG n=1 Tax=Dyella aluminiiresistens TaxID=3069105 RepID=UPI002E787E8F|nr:LPS export ABC transporter permease LptG [Dyella sp. A6]
MDLRIKRVDRLVAISVLGSMLVVWLALTCFDAVFEFLRQLAHVGKNGYTLGDATVYILVTIPRRMYEMFPNAALIGGLLGLGGLASSGELTALRAASLSRMRIGLSAAGVVAVLVVAVVLMGETVGPWGDQQAQAMQVRMKSGNLGLTNDSGLWARDGDRIINAKASLLRHRKDHNEVQLANVRVFTLSPDGQLSRFDWAHTAEHEDNQWVLNNVRSTTLDSTGVHSSQAARVVWDSHLNPRILEQSLILPQYLPMRDLHRNMRYLESNGENPGPYAIAFWARVFYPFNTLVLVLCAMPFAFGTLRSGGLGKRIFIGMLLAIGWYFLQKAMVSFGTVYGVPPMLANLLPAVLLAMAAWLYFRKRV